MINNYKLFLESTKTLKSYLKKYDIEETYGTFVISDTKKKLEEIEKELEKIYKDNYSSIQIENNKLTIFKDVKYSYIVFSSDIKDKWDDILNLIDDKDLYLGETKKDIDDDEYGTEKKPHITLLWGIHPNENKKSDIISWIEKLEPLKLEMVNIGVFENDDYDVVKIDIKPSKKLLEYRKGAFDKFSNTQTFKDFHPHMTIAYCKKGCGKKYTKKLEDKLELIFNNVILSDPSYNKINIKLD